MKITYIFHSCFLVETVQCYYLFDYYMKDLPELNREKPILVFASHTHPDHYNPSIFEKLEKMGMKHVTAVLAKDISKKKYPSGVETVTVTFHQKYDLPCDTQLETLQSTDQGVAFLITCPEGTIYHAGDLNDWNWTEESEQYNRQMTGNYRHEIDLLAQTPVDIAFHPLDPRQEGDYAKGLLYFLKKVNVKKVFPMHYWGKPEIIEQFIKEYPEYRDIILPTEDYLPKESS